MTRIGLLFTDCSQSYDREIYRMRNPFEEHLLRQRLTYALAEKPAESRLQPGLAARHRGKPQTVLAFVSDARRPGPEGTPNRPQVTNLPHKIVAARKEKNGW
jgi:hypothetical protein